MKIDKVQLTTIMPWLKTGFAALAVGGLFAVLLVLARTPAITAHLSFVDFFHTALVVHVDLTVLVWFLANACLLWQLRIGDNKLSKIAQILMAIGMALMVVSGFLPEPKPLMNNYVPVLQNNIFMLSLAFIGVGVLLQALLVLWRLPASSADAAMWSGAILLLAAITAVIASYFMLSDAMEAENYYEMLFWGGGHILQFVHTQMLAFVWLWLAGNGEIGDKWRWFLLLPLLAVPISALPYLHGNITDGFYYNFFTQLMIWGNGAYLLPVALFLAISLWRWAGTSNSAVRITLAASLVLFAAGGLISLRIDGINVIIPAHYHGSIVGISLAYMALWYHLLAVQGRMAFWQPVVYGGGQLIHITGLMISGGYEVARKTVQLSPDAAAGAKFGMGLMGAGGMIAIIGGLMFVLVVWKATSMNKSVK